MRVLQVGHPEPVVRGAAAREDEQPAPVVGYATVHAGGRVILALEDQPLRPAAQRVVEQLVVGVRLPEVRPLGGAAEAGVVESVAVTGPGDPGELHACHHVGELAPGGEVAQVDVLEVRPAHRGGVAQSAAVGRDRPLRHGDRSVGRERVGVEHEGRPPAERRFPVEDRLLLQAGILAEPQLFCLAHGHCHPGVIPQRGEPGADRVAPRDPGEITKGESVLRVDPRFGGRRVEILERAVRVRHGADEVGVHHAPSGRRWIVQLLAGNPGDGNEQRRGECEAVMANAHEHADSYSCSGGRRGAPLP